MGILGNIGKNIGNNAPEAALKIAESTAIGGRAAPKSSRPGRMIGSLEGLITTKSAHIQMNGVGYMNPAFQKARYGNKYSFMKQQHSNYGTISNGFKLSTFSDNSFKSGQSSSASRLAALNKTRFI